MPVARWFGHGIVLVVIVHSIELGSGVEHNADKLCVIEALEALLEGLDRRYLLANNQQGPIDEPVPYIGVCHRQERSGIHHDPIKPARYLGKLLSKSPRLQYLCRLITSSPSRKKPQRQVVNSPDVAAERRISVGPPLADAF